jgi:hypothetical protein
MFLLKIVGQGDVLAFRFRQIRQLENIALTKLRRALSEKEGAMGLLAVA